MKKLDAYVKKSSDAEMLTTSITITQPQMDFVRRLNLNLSKLVRDYLDQLLKETK